MSLFLLLALMGVARGIPIPWTDHECCTFLPFSFVQGPLQLETKNAGMVFLQFKFNTQSSSLVWNIAEGTFWMSHCSSGGGSYTNTSPFSPFTNKPETASTLWLVDLTNTHLAITANSFLVLDLEFAKDSVECGTEWGYRNLFFQQVKFPSQDKGTMRFRNLPPRGDNHGKFMISTSLIFRNFDVA